MDKLFGAVKPEITFKEYFQTKIWDLLSDEKYKEYKTKIEKSIFLISEATENFEHIWKEMNSIFKGLESDYSKLSIMDKPMGEYPKTFKILKLNFTNFSSHLKSMKGVSSIETLRNINKDIYSGLREGLKTLKTEIK